MSNNKEDTIKKIETDAASWQWSCDVCGSGYGTPPCPTTSTTTLEPKYWSRGYDASVTASPVFPHTGRATLTASALAQLTALKQELEELRAAEAAALNEAAEAAAQADREAKTAAGPAWLDDLWCPEHGNGVCPGGRRWDDCCECHRPIEICKTCGAEKGTCIHEATDWPPGW